MTTERVMRAERAHLEVRHRILLREIQVGQPVDVSAIADRHGLSTDEVHLVLSWLADESLVVESGEGAFEVAPLSRYSAARALAVFAPTHRFLLERATVRLDPAGRHLLKDSASQLYSLALSGDIRSMIEIITTCYGVCYSAAGAIDAEHMARLQWSQIIRIMMLVAPEFVEREGTNALVGHFAAIARGDIDAVTENLDTMWARIEDAVVRSPDELWLASTEQS